MDLVYFIILISSLIFVHEVGHFVVAKTFGVKVLTFSLGFGPKIFRIHGKETEYCVGILPLGGFVKMLEGRKDEIVLPEDVKRTFEAQSAWKRILIVTAGPVMNLLFPILLYFVAFLGDRTFLPPTVGVVIPGHAAEGRLLPGDRIMAVDGEPISTFEEFARIVRKSPGKELHLRVFRNLGYVSVAITPEPHQEDKGLDIVETVGRVWVLPASPASAIGISDVTSPAYRSGLRTFDLIIQVGSQPIAKFVELERAFDANRGETVPVTYLRPKPVSKALGGLVDIAVYEAGVAALTPTVEPGDLLARTGIESSDLFAASVPEGSAEDKANMRVGDKIIEVDHEPVPTWHTMLERLHRAPDAPHELTWLRDGVKMKGIIHLRREEIVDDLGVASTTYRMRTTNWVPIAPEPLVDNPAPIRWALSHAIEETRDVMRFTVVGIMRLVQGRLSLSSIRGPLSMYELAGQEGAKGPDYFLWVMALVSVNLGLLNLMPIPVLDGGHLLFFTIEAVIRRPLPLRVREVASIIGLALLFALMGIAFKNDVERRWDTIVGQIKEPR